MCLTLCLGRKGQTLELLEPAVAGLAGLLESSQAWALAQRGNFKFPCKAIWCH